MTKMISLVMGLSVALLVSGCGKGFEALDATRVPKVGPSKVDLAGLSLQEVLSTKYDKVELKCQLWMQKSTKLDLTLQPTDSFSWDMKGDSVLPLAFSLTGKIENHQSRAEITLNSMSLIESLVHQTAEGDIYKLKYSPVVNLSFQSKSVTRYESGPVIVSHESSPQDVVEKLEMVLQNSAAGDLEKDGYANFVYSSCVLDTEIKAEYQDDFKLEKRK